MDKIKYLDEYGVAIIADEIQKALENKADGSAGVALRAEGDENGLNIAENYALAKDIPTKTSDLANDSLFVSNQTLQTGLNKKVDKIDGKTLTTHDFTTEYKNKLDSIDNVVAAADALVFKGTLGTNGTITELPTTYKTGWTYRVITAGTYAGQVCEVGDLITAIVNRSGSGNVNSDWTVAQTNINGALTAASNGLTADGSTVKHNDYITAGSISGGSGTVGYGGSFTIPKITYNAQGHITKVETTTVSLPKSQIGDTKTPVYINSSGVPTPISYTIQTNVPSGAVFTDKNVQQTPTSTEANFPILLAPSDATGGANGSYFASSVNVNPSTGVITASGFSGKGNALTDLNATQLTTGTIPVERLADSKVTAGSYGPTANATPGYGATFNVPQVTVDKYGRVVGATTYTVKIPASDNTDTKNTAGSTNSSKKLFLIGAEAQGANPQTYSHDTAYVGTDGCLYSDSKKVMVEGGAYPYVKLDGSTPMTGDLTLDGKDVDRFINFAHDAETGYDWRIGYLGSGADDANYFVIQNNGTSGTFLDAIKIGLTSLSATFGGNILPATTNAQSIGSSSLKFANIYATTFTGNLSGNANTATTANKLAASTDKGDKTVPVYFKNGVPVACETLSVGTTGNAGSATKLTTDAGDSNTPVYFSGGKPVACTSLDLNTTGNAATATTSNYQAVLDVRDVHRLPSYFTEKSLTAYFNNTGMPGSGWYSGIHVKGWSAGYQSWELASGSNTSANGVLYYRNGIDGTWEGADDDDYGWKQIAFITDNVASATKLTSSAGSKTQPVYFSGGKPVATTYALNKTVPSDAIFTDSNVYQSASTTNNYHSVLFGTTYSADTSAITAAETGQVYKSAKIYASPGTGELVATKFTGALNGNATSASKVANALSINGKTYNGSSAITVGTLGVAYGGTGATTYKSGYVLMGNGTGAIKTADIHLNYTDGTTSTNGYEELVLGNSTATGTAGNRFGRLAIYSKKSAGIYLTAADTTAWSYTSILPAADGTLLNTGNYTSYTVKKDGTGASGSWGISVTGSSASCTGNAASATKLTTSAGSSTLPVYFSSGKPVACGTSLAVSVTGNAATATTATAANKLNVVRSIDGDSHAAALKTEFTNNKASIPRNQLTTYYSSAYSNGSFYMGYFLSSYDSNPYGGFFVAHYNTPYYVGVMGGTFAEYQIWKSGDSVTGAVWNDYAECRQSDTEDFGYVLTEVGDDTLTKTTERLQHFAGISSDTWGFSQGETTNAKTPIAVAGRVLVYPYQPRENYHPGDCVCAAPGGMVDIMTREEVINYPDRIVGTVSCVPDYDEWGGGENADRKPVKVNGRIWVKVR